MLSLLQGGSSVSLATRVWTLSLTNRGYDQSTPPQSPGQLFHSQLWGEVQDDEDALWDPLSAEEIDYKAFSDYQGPSLDLLDLSGLSLELN